MGEILHSARYVTGLPTVSAVPFNLSITRKQTPVIPVRAFSAYLPGQFVLHAADHVDPALLVLE